MNAQPLDLIEPSADPLPPIPVPSCDWMGLHWYALQCNPNRERKAARGLADKGLEAFYPVHRVWRRLRRRGGIIGQPLAKAEWRQIERPLFRGYVFVGLLTPHPFALVHGIEGIKGPVNFAWECTSIPAHEIVRIYDRSLAGEFNEDRRPRRRRNRLRRGDVVQTPFGAASVREAKPNGERILVELLETGKKVRIAVDSLGDGA